MNVLQSSWRRSLAAAALVALLSPFSGDAIAQEERAEEIPTLFEDDRPAEQGRRERESPEARERERGEREGDEREVLMHQVEVLGLAAHALREAERGDAIELVERAIHAREVTLEGRRDDEAQMIRERAPAPGQLAEILGMAADLWREFGNQDRAQAIAELAEGLRAPRDRERERPRREREGEGRERRPEAEREERIGQLKREYDASAERAQQIELELRQRPGDEQARELQGALNEVRERRNDIERQLAELTGDRERREMGERGERERAELGRRVEELMAAHVRAREAGRHEEAERLFREAEEIKRDFERRPDRDRPHPEEREEMERRMQHVRVAVENLHAAGLHEQAEHLAQEMERMAHGRPHPDQPHPPGLDHPSRGEGPPPEHLEGVLREMHEAVRHLNERMEEMTRRMEHEIEAIRHDMEQMARELDADDDEDHDDADDDDDDEEEQEDDD